MGWLRRPATDSYGWQVDDNSKEFEFKDGVFEGDGVAHGKGSWSFANFPGGQLDLTVDLNKNKVTFKMVK